MTGRLHRRGLCVAVVLCMVTLISYHFVDFNVLPVDFTVDYSVRGFEAHDYQVRDEIHYSKYRFSLTDEFKKHVGDWGSFVQKPQAEKCTTFFKFLEKKQPDWELPPLYEEPYDKHAVAKGLYFEEAYKKIKKQKNRDKVENPDTITDKDRTEVNGWFQERVNKTVALEVRMADLMTVVRSYGHCFFGDSEPDKDLQGGFARRLTPFFHDQLPRFETPDGASVDDQFPGCRKYMPDDTLIQYYHENMKGKGIVISAATRYSKDIARLIRVLRGLNNKLPIQIVYRGDLSTKSRRLLQGAAVAPIETLLGESFTDQSLMKSVLPDVDLGDPAKYGSELPIQHLTFVNIEAPMKKLAKHFFKGYNNKILALMFNTFEEVVLVDADAVPLEAPYDMFHSPEYKATGTYFFKDRSLRDSNDWIETNYFSKLMPHDHSSFDLAMGIKPVTDFTMDIPYMRGWRHTQEAGIVMFNRKRHYAANLALLPLALWGEPVKSSIWGDKEMYWLAMSIVGDEQYSWSKYDAASVGEFTSDPIRKMYNATAASEVCSSHPGHMSSSGRILWINSGFSFCKKNGYSRDEKKFPFSTFNDRDILKDLYQAPLRIRDALVPPGLPPLRSRGSHVDLAEEIKYRLESKNRKKDVDQLDDVQQIDSYEPQKGWIKSPCCTDYYYCAYNAIENYDNSGSIDSSGSVFSFAEEDRARYDFLGKFWITGLKSLRNLDFEMPLVKDYPTYEETSSDNSEDPDSQIQRIDS
ncbi:hypothetical protein CXQ85_004138 [Candidozyma haemuli]|uniref:Uncharacterized protein n=1 Tax=Candidozyma haemuli TaxID=45357 RepID=A0A2V1B162_9ASCO|nr:hypothetical protein CXQ85_004138 [[Candida] haemuloni]PVH23844.1 hypothetical protein CXQ85_004138 [[Candida] haemuloni]